MACAEQLELSDFIKGVHENLRSEAKILGPEEAWLKHNGDHETLQKYAKAMKRLATKYWESHSKSDPRAVSRINWVREVCCSYFDGGGFQQSRKRELEIADKADIDVANPNENFVRPYRLLDVGSCYDPFAVFGEFITTAIDIAPAVPCVYKCDFLNVPTDTAKHLGLNKSNELVSLPENFYDVVVFSLVLEYLPSPEQRSLFCKKAYDLLKNEGLLFIITPDSKHVGANYKIMKTWKFLLAEMGFSRIKYEKLPHIHCMAFRKSLDCKITQRWARLHQDHSFYGAFVIPQDFNETSGSKNTSETNRDDAKSNKELLAELPLFTVMQL